MHSVGVQGMASKGKRVQLWQSRRGLGETWNYVFKGQSKFFFSLWHPPRVEYKNVRSTGGRPSERRQPTELRESRKNHRITGENQRGREFQGLLNFAIESSLLITKAIMFFMPSKDHTHDLI